VRRAVAWVREGDAFARVYRSRCGRFAITKRSGGWSSDKRVFWVLSSTQFEIPSSMRTWDTLRDAKDWAELEVNPDWEP
jgi:hypothetical protein